MLDAKLYRPVIGTFEKLAPCLNTLDPLTPNPSQSLHDAATSLCLFGTRFKDFQSICIYYEYR